MGNVYYDLEHPFCPHCNEPFQGNTKAYRPNRMGVEKEIRKVYCWNCRNPYTMEVCYSVTFNVYVKGEEDEFN
jgi:hypothetical protein